MCSSSTYSLYTPVCLVAQDLAAVQTALTRHVLSSDTRNCSAEWCCAAVFNVVDEERHICLLLWSWDLIQMCNFNGVFRLCLDPRRWLFAIEREWGVVRVEVLGVSPVRFARSEVLWIRWQGARTCTQG